MVDPGQPQADELRVVSGPSEGDFIAPSELADADEHADALPEQEEFWRPPTRFGSVPVEKEPLGWDRLAGRESGRDSRRCEVLRTAPFPILGRF